ncbi:MAG: pyruvate ferredoxin oxidoreductase subunit gamma [Bacillota bacterium]
MKEIRIHGRGGQGSVVTAELFAVAAFQSGKFSQAFPYLGGGGERRGAPVQSFVRISDNPIRIRSKIYEPDYVIVKDATLMELIDVSQGIKPNGLILVNSEKPAAELGFAPKIQVRTFPATRIAMETLGLPIMNTAIMGAFAAITGEFTIDSIVKAISEKFSEELAAKNIMAARKAYDFII